VALTFTSVDAEGNNEDEDGDEEDDEKEVVAVVAAVVVELAVAVDDAGGEVVSFTSIVSPFFRFRWCFDIYTDLVEYNRHKNNEEMTKTWFEHDLSTLSTVYARYSAALIDSERGDQIDPTLESIDIKCVDIRYIWESYQHHVWLCFG
jgi:hypothetical protein